MMKTKRTTCALNVISVSLLPPIEDNVFPTSDHVHTSIVQTVLAMNYLKDTRKFKLNVLQREKAAVS